MATDECNGRCDRMNVLYVLQNLRNKLKEWHYAPKPLKMKIIHTNFETKTLPRFSKYF
jgi:hypothetical protein